MTKQIDVINIAGLTIGDEYLFETILLQNKEFTKQLIEKFINVSIEDIEYINTEQTQQPGYRKKGVRFDVYIKSQTGVAYIVELQRRDTKELQKRARYYQAVSDSNQLSEGKEHRYQDLKDNYVIFICREDIFGLGYYKYSFENTCSEVEGLKLNDGAHKIFFNTQGTKGNICEDVKAFLKAIEGKKSDNSFVKELENIADEIKNDEIWRETYMQSLLREQDTFDRGVEHGIKLGIELVRFKKAIEIAKNLLQANIPVDEVAAYVELPPEEVASLLF